jgi:hypothetical protein
MIRPLVIGFFGAILSIGIATYFHLKAYEEPSVYYDTRPSLFLVYAELRGDYVQTSNKILEVEQLVLSKNHSCDATFGLFFDDPDLVATQDLKSWVGCVYYSMNDLPPLIENLKVTTITEQANILSADFAGSPALGPRKVYPKAKKMLGNSTLFPALEIYIYDNNKELKTKYYFLLEQSTVESL